MDTEEKDSPNTKDSNEVAIASTDLLCVRLFRSACSGLWYRNPMAAGSIDAVEMNNQRIYKEDGESTLQFIHRTAEWPEGIFST